MTLFREVIITDNSGNVAAITTNGKLGVQDAIYTPIREWQSIGQMYEVIAPILPDTFKQNIFDFKIDPDFSGTDGQVELVGGRYYIKDNDAIHEDDTFEFAIVDKDDILGLFSTYGLTVGIDVLELKKFIRTHSVVGGQIVSFDAGQSKVLPVGLYFRVSFTSHGATNFKFKIDFIIPA